METYSLLSSRPTAHIDSLWKWSNQQHHTVNGYLYEGRYEADLHHGQIQWLSILGPINTEQEGLGSHRAGDQTPQACGEICLLRHQESLGRVCEEEGNT